jgi:transcriptional regulator with XRE-family HTH domain
VFDIGASLAAARETRGYSLADAERLTNVRVKYLSALERGDFDALPGRTYARAFLRTYASALDLEADRFVAAFEEMVPEPEDEPIAVGTPRRRGIIRPPYLGILVALAVVVGVAAWGASSHDPKTLSAPPVAAAATPPVTQPSTHVTSVIKKVVRPVPARVRPAALVIRATRGDCWLQVRQGGASGALVYEGMLRLGSSMKFTPQSLWVRFGAPGNVDAARGAKTVSGLTGSAPVNLVA